MNKKNVLFLIDAGGTYIKTAFSINGKISQKGLIETKDFEIESIKKIADDFENKTKNKITEGIIACAGPVKNGKCQLVNADLFFDSGMILSATGINFILLNDLEAAAYSLKKKNKSSLIIGLGTGLGVAVIDERSKVITSEEGHMLLDRELFFSIPELRSTIIPQYEFVLGAKKNLITKLMNVNQKKITLQKDRFTDIYLEVLNSFIHKLILNHGNVNFKKVIFIGGITSGNYEFLKKYSVQLKKIHKKEFMLIDDKYAGINGALAFFNEKQKSL